MTQVVCVFFVAADVDGLIFLRRTKVCGETKGRQFMTSLFAQQISACGCEKKRRLCEWLFVGGLSFFCVLYKLAVRRGLKLA